jgi:hypothetical protein
MYCISTFTVPLSGSRWVIYADICMSSPLTQSALSTSNTIHSSYVFEHENVQTTSEAHAAPCWTGTGSLSLGVKRVGQEAEQSLLSSIKVTKEWS